MLRNKKGFSLIELIVVIGILTTLVFVASGVYNPVADTSKECVLITNCGKVASMLEIAMVDEVIADAVDAQAWVDLNIADLIKRADIVNVFADPKAYQIENGTIFTPGQVYVDVNEEPTEPYFTIMGQVSQGVYVPWPALRVRW